MWPFLLFSAQLAFAFSVAIPYFKHTPKRAAEKPQRSDIQQTKARYDTLHTRNRTQRLHRVIVLQYVPARVRASAEQIITAQGERSEIKTGTARHRSQLVEPVLDSEQNACRESRTAHQALLLGK